MQQNRSHPTWSTRLACFSRQKHAGRVHHFRCALVAVSVIGACAGAVIAADDAPRFEQQIQPILQRHCVRCHGPTTHKASLNLASGATLLEGGESGPVIDREKPSESLLLAKIEAGEMPPKGEKPLSREDVALIRRWIESGAKLSADAKTSRQLNQHDVLPILLLRCAACHGRQKQEAGLDIRTKKSLLAGGKSGPAIVPGKPDDSLLVKKITAGAMPPKIQLATFSVKPVEATELNLLREWIAQGAPEVNIPPDVANGKPDPLVSDKDRQFWSFQPPRTVKIPRVADSVVSSRAKNPLDAFVIQKLYEAGLGLSPPADRLTLLRRVHFDLLGLPPDPQVAKRFLSDTDPLAYEKLLDELLASPHYGERWGQYWLDLAGYSDSEGVQDSDLVRPQAYRYRDYVIRALNADKPYDRFLLEQLAGDELADYEHAPAITPELYDNLVATGFLRMSADGTFSGITGFVPDRLDLIDDQLRIVGSSVMGLTIGCARCHSHKFDPIPQRDYFRLAAVFKGALDEHDWLKPTRQPGPAGTSDRYLPYVMTEERAAWQAHDQGITRQVEELNKRLPETKGNAEVKKKIDEQIKALESQRRAEPLIRALWDRGEPSPTYILRRGNYLTPTRLVGPGVPSALSDGRTPLAAGPPWPGAKKTGLRLAFAKWLTQRNHPLTARVLVNRVWKHHFGEGLVRTLDNFGRAGERPSHPELLDWLANEFVRGGWSIKALHRLMLTSATYQQSSAVTPRQLQLDPENRLLSRMPLRRLDAEALHDTLLALSGRLSTQQYGPADRVETRADGLVTSVADSGMRRRSIFVLHRRTQPLTLLADFDRPAMSPNCTVRSESTVAPQALHLMNNSLVHELSAAFAERVVAQVGDDPARQIEQVHWLAYGRPPRRGELDIARTTLADLRAAWRGNTTEQEAARRALGNYCHAAMNSAGLMFVD
jgi:mono/diheme cytochrome c family protein